jgi:probable F420-dependent oxidoreductase
MKVAFNFPFHTCPPVREFVSGDVLGDLGRVVEANGYATAAFTDHPIPSQAWREAGGHDALDPFLGLAFVAAATSKLRLLTYLTVLPYRNPFLLAKTVATLDALSGGRVDLGVGTGYLKSEFFALGVPFDERNARFDEALEVMKLVWTGEPVTYEGSLFSARNVAAMPTPVQQPHPPIWIGGNSKLSRRRVAEKAQGWLPMINLPDTAATRRSAALATFDDFATMLSDLRAQADRVGRTTPIDVMYSPPDLPDEPDDDDFAGHVELARRAADLGVAWTAVNGPGTSLAREKAFVQRYADLVVSRVADL